MARPGPLMAPPGRNRKVFHLRRRFPHHARLRSLTGVSATAAFAERDSPAIVPNAASRG